MRRRPPRLKHAEGTHTARVFGPPGQNAGDEDRFDVECDLCGWLTVADNEHGAEAVARDHERFMNQGPIR